MKKQTQTYTKRALIALVLLVIVFVSFRTVSSSFTGDEENAPQSIILTGQVILENSSNGTVVGQLSAIDPDNSATELVFFLTNNAGGRFKIVGANQLSYLAVANGNDYLDYESNPFYTVTVLVRDPDWNTYEQNFVVIVNNMNEAPTDIAFSGVPFTEGVQNGYVVGTLHAVDPDPSDTHTFTLLKNSGGRFLLNSQNQITVADTTKVKAGAYDITVRATDAMGNSYEKNLSVEVNPTSAPIISSISTNMSDQGVTNIVSWSTDKGAKSRLEYGLDDSYGKMTAYTNTYTSDQTVQLPELLGCTTYDYRARSVDQSGKETVGEEKTLTTTGCTGEATVISESREDITRTTGGSVELQDNGVQSIRLNVPPLFANGVEDVQFQVKSLQAGAVLESVKSPEPDLYLAGQYLYDLKAVTDINTSISEFSDNIPVIISYTDENLGVTDESTLKIYRWDGTDWYRLSHCENDVLNNTVTCVTNKFSTFGLFGTIDKLTLSFGSGKGATLRSPNMERGDFRSTSTGGTNKQDFSLAYHDSLQEVARLNQGISGQIWLAQNTKGEKIFGGYKSGKLPTDRLAANEDRTTRVTYRGGSRVLTAAGSSERLVASAEPVDSGISLLQEKFSEIKGRINKKKEGVSSAERDRALQVIMDDKLGKAKTLLQLYQIASEEMTLCATEDSDYCDEIYDFLASEIAAKEKEVVDQLTKTNNW